MAFNVYQDVFWLQIPEDDVVVVQMFKAEQQFAHVKLCKLFGEASLLDEVEEQLAARAEVHDEVELLFAFESPVQLYDEWVLDFLEDFAFAQDGFHFFLIYYLVSLKNFDCILSTSV